MASLTKKSSGRWLRGFGARVLASSVFALGLATSLTAAADPFKGPLDQPARSSSLAARGPLLAVAAAGSRFVAVGQRGHIVYSDDAGQTWKQASVPVSTDLVAVAFAGAAKGWAVGHGGVVLHTDDAGAHWTRQLDGRQSADIAIRYLEARAGNDPGIRKLIEREKRLAGDGGTQPLMAVHFDSETTGCVAGAFNRLFCTEDGGQTWTPWMDRIDNPDELHFYAIAGCTKGICLAGEQGMVWRFDAQKGRFVTRALPYQGSVFGLLAADGADWLLAFGLRGSLFRSVDEGKSWEKVPIGSQAGITSGAVLPGGAILLATQAGELVRSLDAGKTFARLKSARPMAYYGVTGAPGGKAVVVGSEGARVEAASD
ncbi:WD40/YVTN/BNR-like repeat-containing protein [Ideonella sp. YS5]|uniref:WD40/YVTN/BNR-like repeat-containing protein n=1 Tax=Ideonella sp. YS5 TaxID=3453714 RepID=UPI003EEA069F